MEPKNETASGVLETPPKASTKQANPKFTRAGDAQQLAVYIAGDQPRVDSRALAKQLHNQHKAVMVMVERYATNFKGFGLLPFQKAVITGKGQPERFAMLNEDQAFFLLSLSRNTDHVVDLKAKLIVAFRDARRATEQRGVEYLPTYRALHDEIAVVAAGSTHERFVHVNVNKLINTACGLESGQRPTAQLAQQSMLVVAQGIATRAMHGAPDHRAGYARAKVALQALTAITALEVS